MISSGDSSARDQQRITEQSECRGSGTAEAALRSPFSQDGRFVASWSWPAIKAKRDRVYRAGDLLHSPFPFVLIDVISGKLAKPAKLRTRFPIRLRRLPSQTTPSETGCKREAGLNSLFECRTKEYRRPFPRPVAATRTLGLGTDHADHLKPFSLFTAAIPLSPFQETPCVRADCLRTIFYSWPIAKL